MGILSGSGIKRPPIYRLFVLQLCITLTISVILTMQSLEVAFSAMIGGLIFVFPHLYFTYKSFVFSGARATPQILSSIYQGETTKLITIAVLFAVVFKFVKPLNVMALFFTFIIVMASSWLAPWIFKMPSGK
jgi:ATP synthase protein I